MCLEHSVCLADIQDLKNHYLRRHELSSVAQLSAMMQRHAKPTHLQGRHCPFCLTEFGDLAPETPAKHLRSHLERVAVLALRDLPEHDEVYLREPRLDSPVASAGYKAWDDFKRSASSTEGGRDLNDLPLYDTDETVRMKRLKLSVD